MKTLIGLIISLTWQSGVLSSNQLVQSDSAVIKPGDSHTLTCQASGGLTFGGYYIHWIRQFSDGKLHWLCYIDRSGGTYYNNDVKGRFTTTRDNNNNKLTVKMDNMKIEDTAVYYCARDPRIGGYAMDIWGGGTRVDVTSASPSAPSLFPLISCGASLEPSTTIGCLAKDFLPDSIDFSWRDKSNASYSNGFKKYNSVLHSGGTYAASSQIKVNTVDWSSGSFYCTAKHQGGSKTLEIPPQHAVERKPIVTIHPPINEDVELNGNATIACVMNGFYPKNIEVSWKKNHELSLNAITEEAVSDGNGSFTLTSYIIVSKKDWNTDVTFSCIVKHSPSDFNDIRNVSKSTVCELEPTSGEIKVTAVPPSFETIFLQNTAPLTCIISNMENKDGLEVSWHSNTEKISTKIEDPEYDSSSRRYSAKAVASVCPEDWNTKTFECRVSHPELPRVEVVSLRKPNGQDAKSPIVLLYPPHPDELAKKETATLACLVKSFTPSDIFVKWMDSDNVEQAHVATTGPIEEITSSSKKTYFLLSTLTLTSVEDWNKGKSYTCIVGHESLPLHTTQRTIDKTAGKPTNVNVSLVMSDSC